MATVKSNRYFDSVVTARDTLTAYARYGRARWLSRKQRETRSTTSARHVVIVASDFPPFISGGVYRPAALARYARLTGREVTVVAANDGRVSEAGCALLDYVGRNVEILRTARPPLRVSHSRFPRIDQDFCAALEMFECAHAVLRKRAPPRAVVATGPPFHDFAAGYFLARTLGAHLVLDYRDEWTLCPFEFVTKNERDLEWELRCLDAASLVVFTTEPQRAHLAERYGKSVRGRCIVVPNGWEPDSGSALPDAVKALDSKLTLLFAGTLMRNVARFLEELERMLYAEPPLAKRITLRIVGQTPLSVLPLLERFSIPGVIDSLPVVSQDEAARYMRQADALLLFHDERFERYLPGKIYPYLASGKPILVFDDIGETRRLVESMRAGWMVDLKKPGELRTTIDRLLDKEAPLRNPALDQWLLKHTRQRTSCELLAEIDAL